MDHDITHLSFCIDEDDDEVIINESKLKSSAVPCIIRRIRAGTCEPDNDGNNGGAVSVSRAASEHMAFKEEPGSPQKASCPISKEGSQESFVSFEEGDSEVATSPTSGRIDRQDPSAYYSTLACSPEKQAALSKMQTSLEKQTASEPPCNQTLPSTNVPTLEEISLGTLFRCNIDLTRDEQTNGAHQPDCCEEKDGVVTLDDGSQRAESQQSVEQSCQTSFCCAEPPVQTLACPELERQVAVSASPRPLAKIPTPRSPFGSVENFTSGDGAVNSPRRHPLPGSTPSRIPARGAFKTPESPRQIAKSKDSPSPFRYLRGRTPTDRQTKSTTPRSAGRTNSPWAVVSPVARYIHEKPAPPLVQIVKPKKSPSAKSLCAMASAGVATPRPKVPMAPLSAKKYQSSNMGILSKAGLNQYRPLEPFVIKHTVPDASENEAAGDIEASVIQIIRK